MERRFKVIIEKFPTYNMIGTLVGEIDYAGAKNGWHTLEFSNGKRGLFAGEELIEVFDKE